MGKTTSLTNMWNYPTNLGKIEVHFRSLEVVIRTFLLIYQKGYKEASKFNISLRHLKTGQEVEDNPFTNYDTLDALIDKYNNIASSSDLFTELDIDKKNLIKLRDALAHGRAFYKEESPPYKTMLLLKFSDPEKNIPTKKPKVDFQAVMTDDWLNEKIKWTQNEYMKVVKACKIIEHKNLNKISE